MAFLLPPVIGQEFWLSLGRWGQGREAEEQTVRTASGQTAMGGAVT